MKKMNDAAPAPKRKQTAATRIAAALAITLVVLILIAAAADSLYVQEYLYRNTTAVTVGNRNLSPAEYNFYYYRSYLEFLNTVGTSAVFGEMSVPEDPEQLAQTVMQVDENGNEITWEEFFTARAEKLIEKTFLYYDLAMRNGFAITQDIRDQVDYDFEEKVWFEAENLDQSSVENYLRNNFGIGMTGALFKEHLLMLHVANAYAAECEANVPIPQTVLDDYYQENANQCEAVTYRMFYLSGKGDTAAQQEKNMALAKQRAEELAAQVTDEESFIRLCREYEIYNTAASHWQGASTVRTDQVRYALSHVRSWLESEDPVPGDLRIAQATNGYYILMLLDRSDNSEKSVNIMYFTLSGDNAVSTAKTFLSAFESTDRSREIFFRMSEDKRDINYNQAGYHWISSITYRRQTPILIPACMRQWCFDQPRTAADSAYFVVEDGTVYVAYFESYDDLCSRVIAANDLRSAYFEAWEAENVGQAEIRHKAFFFLTRNV